MSARREAANEGITKVIVRYIIVRITSWTQGCLPYNDAISVNIYSANREYVLLGVPGP
jgi:hypothetical protein